MAFEPMEYISEVVEEEQIPTRTYALNLETGRIDGFVDEIEAVKQFITKTILTPRFLCEIYSDQYGNECWEAIIAEDASVGYVEAVIEGFIIDALSVDERIIEVTETGIETDGDEVYIALTVQTVYGTLEVEEVLSV